MIIGLYMMGLIIAGILWPGTENFWEEYKAILTTPSVLISDYFVVGSIGVSLVNAGLVGLIGLLLVVRTKTPVSGPTVAAVFTLAGFALFGKTPLNIWPIFLGVKFAAIIRKERFRNFIVVALFGTALGPVITKIAFGLGLGYPLAVIGGIVVGMLLPSLASHVLHNHQGFSLYNVGFTCGIMGMYITSYLKLRGHMPAVTFIWGDEAQLGLGIFFTLYFLTFILLGIKGWEGARKLFRLPGTLVTDFFVEQGESATFLNMGLVGLLGIAYIVVVGGVFNGPTIGGLLTMVGFAAFGKHILNCYPVMLGVYLATHFSIWNARDPGPLLAGLFGTTLAPLAGGFGPFVGVLAGMLHLAVVMHVGPFHAGMNLYNNGFAGGLVATLFIAATRWYGIKRKQV